MNCKFVKMLLLTVLALAVAVEGYRLDSSPHSTNTMEVNMMRKMCIKNGANYTAVEAAAIEFVNCMETDFGVKKFEIELKGALMYNTYQALNEVFHKYCGKTPELKACYHKLVKVAAPCFGDEQEDLIKISNNLNNQMLDYICQDDGIIITKFIKEGGPECFQEKTYDIMMCSEMAKSSVLNMDQSSSISVNASYRLYDNLLNCILHSVETCHNPISARIVKEVGEIIKQSISKEVTNATATVPTEQIGNASSSTNTTERGLPTDGSNNNLQELFGNNGIKCNTDQDTKNITRGSLNKLFKLSGTLNVAFNANLYV